MAFVPDFEHDVFVSYAQLDNERLIQDDDSSRWVSTFKDILQTQLDQKLGRRHAASIWMDELALRGNEPLTPDIRKAVGRSATLLAILSEGYFASDWCRQERDIFLEAVGGEQAAAGRIFLVQRDEVPRTEWPDVYRDLIGYQFYEIDSSGLTRTLGEPRLDLTEKTYYARLNRLRVDLAQKLKQMKATAADRPPQPDSPGPAGVNLRPDAPTLFLAEVTADLLEVREEVETYLKQQGLRVLPQRYYSRTPAAYQEAMDRDLADSVLFVQLLGPHASPRTEDVPHGYEGLQLERAKTASKQVLQWLRPDVDIASVKDADHRRFLESHNVMATDLEEFKQTITEAVRGIIAPRPEAPPSNGDPFVLVNAATVDLPVAFEIVKSFEDWDVAYHIIDEEDSLGDVAQSDEYHGLMVIYGQCPEQWVEQRVHDCRKVALRMRRRAPVCAVYVGPPDPKDPLRLRPPRFHVIDHLNQTEFRTFIDAVTKRRAAG